MFCFQSASHLGDRDESLAILHVTRTTAPKVPGASLVMLNDEARMAYEASAYFDNPLKSISSPPMTPPWQPTMKMEMPSAPASPKWEPAISVFPDVPFGYATEGLGVQPIAMDESSQRQPVALDYYNLLASAASSDQPDFDVSTFFMPTTPGQDGDYAFASSAPPITHDIPEASSFSRYGQDTSDPFEPTWDANEYRFLEDDEPPFKRQKIENHDVSFYEAYCPDPYLPAMTCGAEASMWRPSTPMDLVVCA
jgi:hypothetical protein